jgi:hypothetical protein
MYANVVSTPGIAITNATFNYTSINSGGGWYWVNVPDNVQLCAVAPGFQQVCINVGTGPSTPGVYGWFRLPPVPPPQPTNCNCWT